MNGYVNHPRLHLYSDPTQTTPTPLTQTPKQELRNIPLLTEPGTEFHYSLGFDVLGVTLARAAGTPLDKLMKEKIFKPLGMKHTGFHLPAKKPELLAPMVEEEDFGTGVFNDVANLESDKVCIIILYYL